MSNQLSLAIARVIRPIANAGYGLFKLFPVKHQVALLSRQQDVTPLDFELLKDELRRQDSELSVVVKCKKAKPGVGGALDYAGSVVAQLWTISRSKVVVIDGYNPAVSFFKQRKTTYIIQAWHALGAIKKFSFQSLDTPGGRSRAVAKALHMHENYSVVLCGGDGSREHFAEGFGVFPSKVKTMPLPRVDILANPDIARFEQIHAAYPELACNKPIVLYAPTFRDTLAAERTWARALDELASAVEAAGMALVVKAHPRAEISAGTQRAIIYTEASTIDVMSIAAHVVTDYSAVAFETCAARKPLWFYIYDIDEYATTRGLNINPRVECSSCSFTEAGELVQAMVGHIGISADQETFATRYLADTSRGATKALARLILMECAR